MERVELKEIAQNWIDGLIKDKELITAVRAYSSALIAAKPPVISSKPKRKAKKVIDADFFSSWCDVIKRI